MQLIPIFQTAAVAELGTRISAGVGYHPCFYLHDPYVKLQILP